MKVSTNKYQILLQDDYKRDQENKAITEHLSTQIIEAGRSKPLDGLTLMATSFAAALVVGGVLLSLWA
jgi:hypothetical protein